MLEKPLKGDVALLAADRADRWGNLTYRKSPRNFNPTMAMAADLAIVQVRHVVELGEIDPEVIVTPGIFVDRVVQARVLGYLTVRRGGEDFTDGRPVPTPDRS